MRRHLALGLAAMAVSLTAPIFPALAVLGLNYAFISVLWLLLI